MLHGHGNDLYKYSGKIVSDFSSNVLYNAESEKIINHLKENLAKIKNYPDPDADNFKKEISEFHNLKSEKVLITNGSIEAIYMIAQCFSGQKSATIYPCFSEYEDACWLHKHKLTFYKNDGYWYKRKFTEDFVWFANPNNPDGKVLAVEDLEIMLKDNSNTIFIIDEAYGELSKKFISSIFLLKKYKNVIILKSFTKCFAVPGIRLGYILASEVLINKILKYKIPWAVNSMAIEAGLFIVDNFIDIKPDINLIYKESVSFQKEIDRLENYSVILTDSNYFLVKMTEGNSIKLKEYLAVKHGILIRDASNFRGLNNKHFRLSLQSYKENMNLVTILSKYKENNDF